MLLKKHSTLNVVLKAQRFLANPCASILKRVGVYKKQSSYELFIESLAARPELVKIFEKVDARFITDYTLSASSLIYLYDLLITGDFYTVMECGSGASSIAIDIALSGFASGQGERLALSLENDRLWLKKSHDTLNQVQSAQNIQFLYAPTEKVSTPYGEFRTYQSEMILTSLQARKIDLLFY